MTPRKQDAIRIKCIGYLMIMQGIPDEEMFSVTQPKSLDMASSVDRLPFRINVGGSNHGIEIIIQSMIFCEDLDVFLFPS